MKQLETSNSRHHYQNLVTVRIVEKSLVLEVGSHCRVFHWSREGIEKKSPIFLFLFSVDGYHGPNYTRIQELESGSCSPQKLATRRRAESQWIYYHSTQEMVVVIIGDLWFMNIFISLEVWKTGLPCKHKWFW